VWWEWQHPDPIVDLKLLKNRNFGTAVGFQYILGMVLFSTTVLIPQFLQGLLGYTAERAGMALSAGALVLMVMMPVAGRLVSMMDARLMVSIGFLATSLGLYNMTRLDLNVSFGTIVLWRVLQILGLSFIFIPISTLNYVGVPEGKNNQISSFSNFARNFGGSMGTALLTTFLTRTQQTHQSSLAAYAYQQLLRQSSMLSYQNAFWVLSIVAAVLVPWPFVMRRPPKRKKAPGEGMGH
jgi:DHA2 family multidrug resistance protein